MSPTYPHHRIDLATEAIVNAAAKLVPKHGYDASFDFLLNTGVPVEVITRVLSGGPARARPGMSVKANTAVVR